ASTSLTVSSSANPSTAGQNVSFTATITVTAPGSGTPSGTVQFQIDGSNTGNAVSINTSGGITTASISSASLSVGTHTISASYGGDNNFTVSSATTITQTVAKASTSTVLVSSANPAVSGQGVTYTATVSGSGLGNPTGVVIFSDGGTSIGQGNLSTTGSTTTASFSTSNLSIGSHTITAAYGGDSNYTASAAGALTETVSKASTTTAVVASANPSAFGQNVSFTATIGVVAPGAGTPTGTVQFQVDSSNTGSPVAVSTAGGITTASFSSSALAVGSHAITAS